MSSAPLKAAKAFKPVIATANLLASGAVVFREASGHWSATPARAQVAADAAAAAALQAAAEADVAANLVVDLALIPVHLDAGAPTPVELRERIRATGPTFALPGAPTPRAGAV
jgi:hypothetical protein